MKIFSLIAAGLILVLCFLVSCKTKNRIPTLKMDGRYIAQTFKSSTIELPYRIMGPANVEKGKKLPLVIFLHGAGERGNDNNFQLVHGSKMFMDSLAKYPAYYIFPQCPIEDYWSNVTILRDEMPISLQFYPNAPAKPAMQATLELIDNILKAYPIDKSQIKLMGLSMGGMGTFELLKRRPELFDSAIAICGGGHPLFAKEYNKNLRLWIAHGDADNVVSPIESKKMFDAITNEGINPRYTVYKGVGHNSWDNVFAEKDYLSWLFK